MTAPELDGVRFPFARCGREVTIYELVRILEPERISLGSHVIIDDFVFMDGGGGISIGSHVHIASHASIIGGGRVDLGDFSGLSTGVRLVSGTDAMDGSGLVGPTIPEELRSTTREGISLGRHVTLGANAVVLPGTTIGEGAIVGAQSLVLEDLPPWTICWGSPARPMKPRERQTIEKLERRLNDQTD
jgi:acetyltransferase-like isoleucine patch superfamily enzyme